MSVREEIQAAAAAHRELGPGYDAAVAEGLVERIGEEIDKRVDARLSVRLPGAAVRAPAAQAARPSRLGAGAVVLALGSMALAIGATAVVLHPGDDYRAGVSGGQAVLVALIWIVIALVNVACARRR
ncbi:MAG: hypothetical protein JO132_03715 [Streptosporangiaceae bacterium]|nr:hypothetical protein [Streptosporangiaceae bacterium]